MPAPTPILPLPGGQTLEELYAWAQSITGVLTRQIGLILNEAVSALNGSNTASTTVDSAGEVTLESVAFPAAGSNLMVVVGIAQHTGGTGMEWRLKKDGVELVSGDLDAVLSFSYVETPVKGPVTYSLRVERTSGVATHVLLNSSLTIVELRK